MKIFVKIVLFFFVVFLFTPAIVEWVEKDKERTELTIDDTTPSSIEEIKLNLMKEFVQKKFENPFLAPQLVATGDSELIHENSWNDKFLRLMEIEHARSCQKR